ncbi:MAG: DUF799 domain-containing protein [Gammaproteobacteria bacterium]|nr:DUF799 domain-containing protein [Gammaproteobacteria bacterium]
MNQTYFILLLIFFSVVASGCVGLHPEFVHDSLNTAPPRVIAVLPPENLTSNTEVEEKLYPIISTRLAERGFYVISPEMVREIFNANKLEEAAMINQLDPKKFNEIFGADAIIKTRVTEWSSKYIVLSSTVNVGLDMELYDAQTGNLLWKMHRLLSKAPNSNNNGGLVGALINAAIHAAVVPYEPIADENTTTMYSTIPNGPFMQAWGIAK